jgi:hypothetical protein
MTIVRLPAVVARPPTRAAARSMAARAVSALPDLPAAFPAVSGWFARVTQVHETRIDRMLAREAALRQSPAASRQVQPGLFDRRALREAEDVSDAERAISAEHGRRIAALDRARHLRISCTPTAVLIVWR